MIDIIIKIKIEINQQFERIDYKKKLNIKIMNEQKFQFVLEQNFSGHRKERDKKYVKIKKRNKERMLKTNKIVQNLK